MIEWLLPLFVWLTPVRDAEALRSTAPGYLDVASAREHLAAARVAGAVHRVDPDLLLAIAWRESRYVVDAVTREIRGRVSCGVMTPKPITACPKPGLLGGYLAGAEHLRSWMCATRTKRDALLGYAGGYRMIEACRRGPVVRVRSGRELDLCTTPELRRSAWIRGSRSRVSTPDPAVW